jgi:hypothetical protein
MYLIRQSDLKSDGKFNEKAPQHNYELGGKKPRNKDGTSFEDVIEVYADGRELKDIRQRVTGIPDVPSSSFVVWKQPFAQFIYDSLIYVPERRGDSETGHFGGIG